MAALAAGGAALLAAGVAIGAVEYSRGSPQAPPAAGPTGSATPGATAGATAGSTPQDPVPAGALPPPTLPDNTSSRPELTLGQPTGDGYTVFVVHGSGFVPLTQVRVALAGVGVSAYRPFTDRKGTFNYAIDQGHQFFPGQPQIPPGQYTVVVTGALGRRATASFAVVPPDAGPPPPG